MRLSSAALMTLCMTQLMNAADVTVVNVALPALRQDLGFDPASVSWVINGYLVALTATLLIAGRLCDAFGSRAIFLTGVSIFSASSLGCALVENSWSLILFRIGQGTGASLATAAELTIIISVYRLDADRVRSLALLSFAGIVGASVGLVGGGAIVQWLSWRWIFVGDAALGVATIVLGLLVVPRMPPAHPRPRVKAPSALVLGLGLTATITAIVGVDGSGWPSGWTFALAVIGALLMTAFLLMQRGADPLLPLGVLRSRVVLGGGFVLAILSGCMLGQFYLQTQYLSVVMGYDSLSTGLAFMPINIIISLVSLTFGRRMISRFGTRRVLAVSLAVLTVGLFLYARQPTVEAVYLRDVLPPMILSGGGGGLAILAATVAMLSSTTTTHDGLLAGLTKLMQQAGGVIGIAILACATAIFTTAHNGLDSSSSIAAGLRGAMVVAGVMSLLALLVVTAGGIPWRRLKHQKRVDTYAA